MVIFMWFLSGLAVEFGVRWVSRKSRNRDIWQWLPMVILVAADFLYCWWWSVQSRMEFHEQGNCIGGMLYVIGLFGLLIPPLAGIGSGRLAYWTIFERKK